MQRYLFLILTSFAARGFASAPPIIRLTPINPPPTTAPYYSNGHYMGTSQSVNGGTSYYNGKGQYVGQSGSVAPNTSSYFYNTNQNQYQNVDSQPN